MTVKCNGVRIVPYRQYTDKNDIYIIKNNKFTKNSHKKSKYVKVKKYKYKKRF